MKSRNNGFKSGEEGRGAVGCVVAIALMAIVLFFTVKLGPAYFNHYEFKGNLKQVIARAGASAASEETIIQDLIKTAGTNNIVLKKENIKITRFSDKVRIHVEYIVPINFLIMKYDLKFPLEETGFAM